MKFTSFLESAFRYYTTSLKNMFSFVETTHELLKEDQIAKIEKKVADAHLRAAIETAEIIQYEKDHYDAAHRILTHLEQAYQIYLSYYNSCPKAPMT